MSIDWQPLTQVSIPEPALDWIGYELSMSARLKECCDHSLEIQLIRHEWGYASGQDSLYLNIPERSPVICREVILRCFQEPWMYARTVLPKNLVDAVGDELLELGARPIGEVLFADPDMTRSDFEVANLRAGVAEYDRAKQYSGCSYPSLWARRSIFDLPHQGQCAITEVFFPICWTS